MSVYIAACFIWNTRKHEVLFLLVLKVMFSLVEKIQKNAFAFLLIGKKITVKIPWSETCWEVSNFQ